jgi:hypothetical protein
MENLEMFVNVLKNWFDDAHHVGGLWSMKQFMRIIMLVACGP